MQAQRKTTYLFNLFYFSVICLRMFGLFSCLNIGFRLAATHIDQFFSRYPSVKPLTDNQLEVGFVWCGKPVKLVVRPTTEILIDVTGDNYSRSFRDALVPYYRYETQKMPNQHLKNISRVFMLDTGAKFFFSSVFFFLVACLRTTGILVFLRICFQYVARLFWHYPSIKTLNDGQLEVGFVWRGELVKLILKPTTEELVEATNNQHLQSYKEALIPYFRYERGQLAAHHLKNMPTKLVISTVLNKEVNSYTI